MAKAQIDQSGAPIAIRQQLASAPKNQRKSILSRYFPQVFTAEEFITANPELKINDLGGPDQLFYLDEGKMKLVDPPGFIQSVSPGS